MFIFEKNTPRWIIFFIDLALACASLTLAFLLRFNFAIPEVEVERFPIAFSAALVVRAISFYISKTYKGIVRYTGSKDAQRIFIVNTLVCVFFFAANFINVKLIGAELFLIPTSVVIIDYLALTFLMISLRIMFKALYFELKNPAKSKRSVIIYGAGEAGIIAQRTLDRDLGTRYHFLGFIDDDKSISGRKVEGVTIYPLTKLDELLQNNDVAHVIISVANVPISTKQKIVELCLKYKTRVLHVPPASSWINGELSFKQIKRINIEDLLQRDPIKLNEDAIRKEIANKVVLITGAAGSIGSELVRQVAQYNPMQVILLDQAESGLYDIEMELLEKYQEEKIEVVIGDVRNKERMRNLFKTFKPAVVFHAAAYKHVPMMENNPSESIFTNVLGTKTVADLSVEFGVEKFIMISTDKAVNPTSVMGASKRIAEIYTQALNKNNTGTRFITTRFGNVLGSSGSVIPRFRQQIEKGGPITITHPEINRFFMTIPEACQLVLEAAAMGKGGEIFIFDMGKSVKIVDLAKNMIELSGLTLDKDIQIVYTGLRPGEKLYEELLNNSENTVPTHHSQIMIAKVQEYSFDAINKQIEELISLFNQQNNNAIVKKMKQIVPEYVSNNSVFEKLD